jgi:hypothetical protein
MALAAALTMCAGVSPTQARIVRVQNTLKLRRMWVSEALLEEVEGNDRLRIIEGPQALRLDEAPA